MRRMRVRRAGCRARLLPLDQRPDVLDQHGDGDRVEAALGDDDVGVFLGRFDELLVHGLHGGGVLGDYGLHGASPLADIAQDTPCQADIRVGIHKNFNVHQLPQLLVLEDEDAVHNDHFRRTHGHSLGHAVMLHERIDRMLDGYVALERPNMPDKHVGIESLGMVVVELGALLVGQLRMGLVVVVVAKRDHLALKSFLKTFDQRALAGTGAAGNPDDRYVHKFDSLSLCPVCLTSPSGTAGRPMLEVLTGSGIRNIAVVVTRYFGGTLLGTGGLVRAYTQAVKEGLAHCETGILRKGCELEVTTDYNDVGKLQYYFGQQGIVPMDSIYAENVKFILLIPMENEEKVRKNLTETTCGKVKIEKLKETYFVDKE